MPPPNRECVHRVRAVGATAQLALNFTGASSAPAGVSTVAGPFEALAPLAPPHSACCNASAPMRDAAGPPSWSLGVALRLAGASGGATSVSIAGARGVVVATSAGEVLLVHAADQPALLLHQAQCFVSSAAPILLAGSENLAAALVCGVLRAWSLDAPTESAILESEATLAEPPACLPAALAAAAGVGADAGRVALFCGGSGSVTLTDLVCAQGSPNTCVLQSAGARPAMQTAAPAVALSADGLIVAAGAPDAAAGRGRALLATVAGSPGSGGVLSEFEQTAEGDAAGEQLGAAVALGEGLLIAGAPGAGAGAGALRVISSSAPSFELACEIAGNAPGAALGSASGLSLEDHGLGYAVVAALSSQQQQQGGLLSLYRVAPAASGGCSLEATASLPRGQGAQAPGAPPQVSPAVSQVRHGA